MKCSRCRELLSWYLSSDLQPGELGEIEKHLSTCKECLDELKLLKGTLALVRELPPLEPPPEICSQLLSQVEAWALPKETTDVWEEIRDEGRFKIWTLETGRQSASTPTTRKAYVYSRFWTKVVKKSDGTWWGFTEIRLT